mmetsp:Transcript_44090/g.133581  ORF Transcript_44090/g.133581 Transcript_44090/m.133581 type:complete len:207 (-) Transcript_44090:92-712(-)
MDAVVFQRVFVCQSKLALGPSGGQAQLVARAWIRDGTGRHELDDFGLDTCDRVARFHQQCEQLAVQRLVRRMPHEYGKPGPTRRRWLGMELCVHLERRVFADLAEVRQLAGVNRRPLAHQALRVCGHARFGENLFLDLIDRVGRLDSQYEQPCPRDFRKYLKVILRANIRCVPNVPYHIRITEPRNNTQHAQQGFGYGDHRCRGGP